eukprot:TRINITY_DN11049_c0_g1_i1.p1 TRINITY_DN11049_c0_g1~~TRINITY_DN11049_c0_g1_i1.p1  ORF type:complete len:277 (-),score=32.71 TRINITY_DN11049_c0_g1_i1:25-855(-)
MNVIFLASLFSAKTGLADQDDIEDELLEQVGVDQQLLDSMAEEVAEERNLCVWVNSVLHVNAPNLFRALKDGKLFLQLLDTVAPGCVDQKKLKSTPTSLFLKVELCNHVIDVARKIGMRIIGFGGKDIVDGNRRFLLALTHQIWRFWILQHFGKVILNRTCSGKLVTEAEIISWANSKIVGAGRKSKISSLEDRQLCKGIYIIDLLYALYPKVGVDYSLVTSGQTLGERDLNACYVLSLAWAAGLPVYIRYQNIVNLRPGTLLAFLTSLLQSGLFV